MSLGLQAGETAGASASLGPATMPLWRLNGALTPNCHNGLGEAFAQWLVRCEAGVCIVQPCLPCGLQTVGPPGMVQAFRKTGCLAPSPNTVLTHCLFAGPCIRRHVSGDARSPSDVGLCGVCLSLSDGSGGITLSLHLKAGSKVSRMLTHSPQMGGTETST